MPLLPAEEYSIGDLARCVASQFNNMQVQFDTSKADGQHRKCMSNAPFAERLANFVFTPLAEGIRLTVEDYMLYKNRYRHGTLPATSSAT